MFHKGRVFLCMIQQCISLAFEKNLGMGFPWRQLPNNLIQPTLITPVCAALGSSQKVQYLTSFLILAVLVSPDSSLPVCRQRPPGVEDPARGFTNGLRASGSTLLSPHQTAMLKRRDSGKVRTGTCVSAGPFSASRHPPRMQIGPTFVVAISTTILHNLRDALFGPQKAGYHFRG